MDLEFTQVRVIYQPPPPPYPPLARSARVQGTVVVQIVFGQDGVPITARALEGPLQLRAAAEAYALAWRFEPCLQNGVPQLGRFKLTITYRIH
jgi:protein TonB